MTKEISQSDRDLLASLATVLLPAYGKLPSAASVDVRGALLDEVLTYRPDLIEPLQRGLSLASALSGRAAAEAIAKADPGAFDVVALVASAAYLLSPDIRAALGYPGQDNVPYDAHAVPEYITNGFLDRVLSRGPIFRDTRHLPS